MNRNYEETRESIWRNGRETTIRSTDQADEFVNPYNFVPLKEQCDKDYDAFELIEKGDISGTITCTLETLTPLFIPNTTTDKAFPFSNTVRAKPYNGKAYDFFSYENLSKTTDCTNSYAKPIIPGSSIRGAVRSAYEAVTNSCLSTCGDEDLILHRRTTKPKPSYGIIEEVKPNSRVVHKAEKVMLNTARYHGKSHNYGISVARTDNTINIGGVEKRTGDTVYIELESTTFRTSKDFQTSIYGVKSISFKPQPGYKEGILFLGEKFQNKHHDSVFLKSASPAPTPLSENDFERFFKVWEQYQNDTPGSYPNYINLKNIPVYYSNVGSKLYLAPACVSKEVFDASFQTLLGSYAPCTSAKKKVCSACALFGLVSDETEGTVASRIMFHDATPLDFSADNASDFYEQPRQLPILGTPRISATEFYTDDYSERYKVWNYDYGIRQDNGRLEGFQPKLRGRKFYWHKKELTPFNETDRADLTAKIRAVKLGKKFSLKITFDRLSSKELNTLLWVLTFGGKTTHAHKLGHGKPVGYGSVRYTIDSVTEYKLQDDMKLEATERALDYAEAEINDKRISQYLKLTDFENAPSNVSYPNGKDSKGNGVYQWFSLNKGKMNDPEFQQVLATPDEIMSDDKTKPPVPDNSIGAILMAKEAEKAAKKTTYDRSKIKNALTNFKINPQSRKLLDNFKRDYETDPEYYKDYKQLYESVKSKY